MIQGATSPLPLKAGGSTPALLFREKQKGVVFWGSPLFTSYG